MNLKRPLATEFTEGTEKNNEFMFLAEHLWDDPMASTYGLFSAPSVVLLG